MVEMHSEDVPVVLSMLGKTEDKMDELLEILPDRMATREAVSCGAQWGMAERISKMKLKQLMIISYWLEFPVVSI